MKRYTRYTVGLMLGMSLMAWAASSTSATLIQNGDFAANANLYTSNYGYSGGSNPVNPTDWAYGGGGAGGVNGPGTASTVFGPHNQGGLNYAFLQGSGEFRQDLTLAVGATYSLSFKAASRWFDPAAGPEVVIADGNGAFFDTGVLTPGSSQGQYNDGSFTSSSYLFTAPAVFNGTPYISLMNTDASHTADFTEVALVNFVPEPGTTVLVGLGGLIVSLWTRRQRVK